ncbi:MAG: hypothetical protein OEU26_16285 [Candidatus Tectomicrobia bacterium]|nr:hypothetical protein [Candidatus Tectomicrobia bacterium]
MSDDVVFVGCRITDAAEPVPEAMTLMGMEVSPDALLIGPERMRQMDAKEHEEIRGYLVLRDLRALRGYSS